MALSARLEIRQGQGLVITPQLQQAIKLLQMSNLELEAFVETELERNPLLARDERDNEADEAPHDEAAAPAEHAADAEARADLDTTHDEASPGERATGDAPEAADVGGAIDWSKAGSGGGFDHGGEGFGTLVAYVDRLMARFYPEFEWDLDAGVRRPIAA